MVFHMFNVMLLGGMFISNSLRGGSGSAVFATLGVAFVAAGVVGLVFETRKALSRR